MSTSITAFNALIDIAEGEQCDEVEEYLKSKGAEVLSSDDSELLSRLQRIIEQCHCVFQNKEIPSAEVEGFFFSVVSLFHIIPSEQTKDFVKLLCSKISEGANSENAALRLRLLGLMFTHFDVRDPLSYHVLCERVCLAGKMGLGESLSINVEKLRGWIERWLLSGEEKRRLYSLLWEAYKDSGDKRLSCQILTELLKSSPVSSSETASLATKLVVIAISNPDQFVFDHFLRLECVSALKSEKIYKLLSIFVGEKLQSFVEFYRDNKEFVDGLGLEYDYCVRKLRLLTLASLAVEASEVSFHTLCGELDLPSEEVELVVMDAIRLKLISARINQINKKLIITSSIFRTFEIGQWSILHDRLSSWKQSLSSVNNSLETISTT